MVILDGQESPFQSVEVEDRQRASSEYSCLRGRLINMDYK